MVPLLFDVFSVLLLFDIFLIPSQALLDTLLMAIDEIDEAQCTPAPNQDKDFHTISINELYIDMR